MNRAIKFKNSGGYVVLLVLVFLLILSLMASALIGYTTLNLKGSRVYYQESQALFLAEAGVEKAINELNLDSGYSGETDTALGDGTFSVSVSTVNSNTKRITATGYIPNSSNPKNVKTVKATAAIDTSIVSFNYGVQVGAGGMVLDNNSRINGNVYSNGSITGGKASSTGDIIVAAGTSLTPDEQWTVDNSEFSFGDSVTRKDVAQSFKPGETNRLNKVQVYIKKVGNPGDLTVKLLEDNSGSPSKTVLASANIAASLVTSSLGWIEATFGSSPNLSSGVPYWLMLSAPTISSSSYYVWATDSNNGYGNGVGKYSSNWSAKNPVWSSVVGDFNYKTFMGGVATYFDANMKVGGDLTATDIRDCDTVNGTAYYDTVFTSCSAGGSVSGSEIPGPEPMPISSAQIDDWKDVAEEGGTLSGPYTITTNETLGPIKIDGDLSLDNNAILNITGPIWVKGNITFGNGSKLYIASSLGNSGTVLLADNPDDPTSSGIVTIANNAVMEGNGNPNSFPLILTANSNLSGAMYINNNSAGAIYYASNGSIEVSNNAGGNQITGYKVHLNENAIINYSTGLADSSFSTGPGAGWAFLEGSYVILSD